MMAGMSVYTEMQCQALRTLLAGPQRAAHFDGRTVRSLLSYGLIVSDGSRVELTERGARAASTIGIVEPQPMTSLSVIRHHSELPPPAPDGMAEVCCEAFEAAVAAEVIVVGSDGSTYINTPKKWWRIAHCPWCPEERP